MADFQFISSQVEVMTLLQQEKSSEKMSLEKQIEDAQQSLNKREKEFVVVKGEFQQVLSLGSTFFHYFVVTHFLINKTFIPLWGKLEAQN